MLRCGGSDALLLGASSSILLLLLVLIPIVSPSPSPNLVLTSILCKSCPVAREEGVNHAVTSPGPLLRSLFRPLRGGSDDTAVNDVGIEGTKPTRRRLKIALEGNIAAGKSTLLRLLEDDVDYVAVPEPLAKWQQVYHEPIGMIAAMVRWPQCLVRVGAGRFPWTVSCRDSEELKLENAVQVLVRHAQGNQTNAWPFVGGC
jgi:hypothetical protein